jgi:hypothetical protein
VGLSSEVLAVGLVRKWAKTLNSGGDSDDFTAPQ